MSCQKEMRMNETNMLCFTKSMINVGGYNISYLRIRVLQLWMPLGGCCLLPFSMEENILCRKERRCCHLYFLFVNFTPLHFLPALVNVRVVFFRSRAVVFPSRSSKALVIFLDYFKPADFEARFILKQTSPAILFDP